MELHKPLHLSSTWGIIRIKNQWIWIGIWHGVSYIDETYFMQKGIYILQKSEGNDSVKVWL